jgi:hypothetical protein
MTPPNPTADTSLSTLPGSLPGLLRRGAPVFIPGLPESSTLVLSSLFEGRHMIDPSPYHRISSIEPHRLALDLTDPAGRDVAVRWGAETETAAARVKAEAVWSRHIAKGGTDEIRDDFDRVFAIQARGIADKWHALRDNPAALAAACLTLGAPNV